MLIVWSHQLDYELENRLCRVDPRAVYWPYSRVRWGGGEIVCDWWISFSNIGSGIVWVIEWSSCSRVVYRE